ncbi:MAG: hypothetical protein ACLU9S_11225 [Oscillospiraceae bacterium]
MPDNGCYAASSPEPGCSHWDPHAQGNHCGPCTKKRQQKRATMNLKHWRRWIALAYQTVDVLRAMRCDSGITTSALAEGGRRRIGKQSILT